MTPSSSNGSREVDQYKFSIWVSGEGGEFEDTIDCVNFPQVEKEIRKLKAGNWMYGQFRIESCIVLNSRGDHYKTIF